MTRSPGSGLYGATAEAVEDLLAARLRSNAAAAARAFTALTREHAHGRCGMAPADIDHLISAAAAHMGLLPTATRLPIGDHADVIGRDGAGQAWAYEVKAQTTKHLVELVQADWVRQETDWLRAEAVANSKFAAALPPLARSALSPAPAGSFNTDELLACDVAVLPTAGARTRAGVVGVATLQDYAEHKWLVHLAQDGVALIRIADIPLFAAAVSGAPVTRIVRVNRAGPALHVKRATEASAEYLSYNYDRTGIYTGRHKLSRRATLNAVVLT